MRESRIKRQARINCNGPSSIGVRYTSVLNYYCFEAAERATTTTIAPLGHQRCRCSDAGPLMMGDPRDCNCHPSNHRSAPRGFVGTKTERNASLWRSCRAVHPKINGMFMLSHT
eukprot:scaffold132507_cov30-Tisochrysis_lutea.AAC.2